MNGGLTPESTSAPGWEGGARVETVAPVFPGEDVQPQGGEYDYARDICLNLHRWREVNHGGEVEFLTKLLDLYMLKPRAYELYIDVMCNGSGRLEMSYSQLAELKGTTKQNEQQCEERLLNHVAKYFPEFKRVMRELRTQDRAE